MQRDRSTHEPLQRGRIGFSGRAVLGECKQRRTAQTHTRARRAPGYGPGFMAIAVFAFGYDRCAGIAIDIENERVTQMGEKITLEAAQSPRLRFAERRGGSACADSR